MKLHQMVQPGTSEANSLLLLAIEADLTSAHYQKALERTKSLQKDHPNLAREHAPLIHSFQSIAHFGLGEPNEGTLHLTHFLKTTSPRAPHLLKIAERLLRVSTVESAMRVLNTVVSADPQNHAALTRLVTVELAHHRTAELPKHLKLLLATRRPSPDLLRVAHHQLGSDAFLFVPDREPILTAIGAQLAAADSLRRDLD